MRYSPTCIIHDSFPMSCTSVAGHWTTHVSGSVQLVTIVQSAVCTFVATDTYATWSPANGAFATSWSISMTFNGRTQSVGRLVGCSATSCPAGSTVSWSDANHTVWTKQGAPGPAPTPVQTGSITLREDFTMCLDSTGADNQDTMHVKPCVAKSTAQLFTRTSAPNLYLVLDAASSAAKDCSGSPCCIENWMGKCTVFACDDIQGVKHWLFNKTTGTITNQGQCMTAAETGSSRSVSVRSCIEGAASQTWMMTSA